MLRAAFAGMRPAGARLFRMREFRYLMPWAFKWTEYRLSLP